MSDLMDPEEALEGMASELEAKATRHRELMAESEDPLERAEHRGISRAFLYVATQIRTALMERSDLAH